MLCLEEEDHRKKFNGKLISFFHYFFFFGIEFFYSSLFELELKFNQ